MAKSKKILFITGFLSIILLGLASQLLPKHQSKNTHVKLLFVGIDGGTWEILDPLIEQNRLPNIKNLKEKGSYGVLESTPTDTYSPIVWTTVMTGKTREHHGIIGWTESIDNRARKAKTLAEILCLNGTVVSMNVPGTYPPSKVNGLLVSGFPMSYTFVGSKYGRFHVINTTLGSQTLEFDEPENFTLGVDIRRLTEDGIVFTYKNETIKLEDGGWSDWILKNISGKRVRFRFKFLTYDDTPILFSSPFFNQDDSLEYTYPNELKYELEDNVGLYIPQETNWNSPIFLESEYGLETLFESVMEISGIRHKAAKYLIEKDDYTAFIVVYTVTDRIMHVFMKFIHRDWADKLDKEFRMRFYHTIPKVYERADEYVGDLLEHVDDRSLVVLASDHGFGIKPNGRGDHHPDGFIILYGPGVKRGHLIENASLTDVTPTILYLMGYPVFEDMDGRVLTEIVDEEFLREHPVRYVPSYESIGNLTSQDIVRQKPDKQELEDLEEHLKALGYL